MKKIRGDKTIRVIIHTYMEISQGNSLHSYLDLKQAKMSWFSFIYFTKSKNRRVEQVLPSHRGRLLPVEGVQCWGKRVEG
jgi:hypothetical protein